MGLFEIKERDTDNIKNIVNKTQTKIQSPTIKLKGTSVLSQLNVIKQKVYEAYGDKIDDYEIITEKDKFIEYCKKLSMDEYIAIDTETTSLDSILAKLVGLCLYSKNTKPAYIPVGHISTITQKRIEPQIDIETIKEGLKIIEHNKLLFHNAYYDIVVLYQNTGIKLKAYDDTLIMAWYLNENEPHGLKYLYDKYIDPSGIHTFADLFTGIPFCYIPYNVGGIYGAHDAEMTYKLWEFFKKYLTPSMSECQMCDLQEVANIYETVEKPLIDVLVDMKIRGIKFDFECAKKLKIKYEALRQDAIKEFYRTIKKYDEDIKNRQKIHNDVEYPLNFNSPAQISILFYDIMNIGTVYRKEPRGTGSHVLEEILNNKIYREKPIYDIAKALRELKRYEKLINTFIDKLTEDAKNHNGRIYGSYNQCGTNTLRLSSNEPNLQNLPAKASDIRNMFIPDDGCYICNLDFSQQEMMCVASLADDDKMLDSFRLGRDIYSHVASIAFKVPYEDCLEFYPDGTTNEEGKNRRKKSKNICLGIVYGKGIASIADDLHVTIETAQEIKDSILCAFPKLAHYLEEVVKFGKQNGYVKNFFGVKRRLPALQLKEYEFIFNDLVSESSKKYYESLYIKKLQNCRYRNDKKQIIEEANTKGITIKDNGGLIAQETRNAYNSPVQSSAAILTKMAMNNIYNNKRLKELGVSLLLTIHDEVGLNIPKKNAYEAVEIAKKEFLSAGKDLQADLRCDIVISDCWSGTPLFFDENNNLVQK